MTLDCLVHDVDITMLYCSKILPSGSNASDGRLAERVPEERKHGGATWRKRELRRLAAVVSARLIASRPHATVCQRS